MLVVLTPYEAENFFPPPLLAELRALAPDFRPLDPTGLSAADFARELAAANPAILLACCPPPLPPASAQPERFSLPEATPLRALRKPARRPAADEVAVRFLPARGPWPRT